MAIWCTARQEMHINLQLAKEPTRQIIETTTPKADKPIIVSVPVKLLAYSLSSMIWVTLIKPLIRPE